MGSSTSSSRRGTRFLQQHRYAEAIESFQRALALAPGSERASECLCGLGVAYSQLQRYEESWRYLELAHQRRSPQPPSPHQAGRSLREEECPGKDESLPGGGAPLMTEERSVPDVQPLETCAADGSGVREVPRHGPLFDAPGAPGSPRANTSLRMRNWQESRQNKLEPSFHVEAPGSMSPLGPPPGPRKPRMAGRRRAWRSSATVSLASRRRSRSSSRKRCASPVNRQPTPDATRQVALHLFVRQWPMKVVATLVNVRPGGLPRRGPQHWRPRSTGGREHSEPLVFVLVPRSLGPKTIRIRFEQDNTFVTTARIPHRGPRARVPGGTGAGAGGVRARHRAPRPPAGLHALHRARHGADLLPLRVQGRRSIRAHPPSA